MEGASLAIASPVSSLDIVDFLPYLWDYNTYRHAYTKMHEHLHVLPYHAAFTRPAFASLMKWPNDA